MPRQVKSEKPDPRVDDALLRHVRLVKPHLAAHGFRTDKWATIAAAVNRDVGHKVWNSGNGAQGRYSHLVQRYHKGHRDMTPALRDRFKDYLTVLKQRSTKAGRREGGDAAESDGEADDEEEAKDDEEDTYEDDEAADDEEIEEIQLTRDTPASREATTDLVNGAPRVRPPQTALAHAAPSATVTSVALFHDTVTALREMTSGLLHVIEQDHVARREETQRNREDRKELLEVVRLALQPKSE